VIPKIKWIHFSNKQEKVVLVSPTQNKNKKELCLAIFCNFQIIFSHINLDGVNKISVSKELRLNNNEGPRT
jgi:hypothetical protein